MVEQEVQGSASGGVSQEMALKELLALKEVLGVLRRTGMSVQQLVGVLVGNGDGMGRQEVKAAVDEVNIKPEGKTASQADDEDDDGAPIPEDPLVDWNVGELRRRVPASFVYAEASEEDMALEYERLDIIGRVIGA